MSQNESQIVVVLENVRLSYVYAFDPYVGKNDQGQETRTYSAHAIMDPTHAGVQKVKDAQRAIAAAGWGPQADAVLQQLLAQDKLCLHAGDISKMGQEAYKGKVFVSANGKARPRIVVTRGGTNVDIEKNDPYAPYSGCWANMIIAVYGQGTNAKPNKFGKRINAQLMGLQFLRHDTAFGGGGKIATPDEFPIVAGTDADGAAPVSQASGLV
jgi:hypothetical protein